MRLAVFLLVAALVPQCFADTATVTFDGLAVEGELQVLPGGIFNGMRFLEQPTVGALHIIDNGGCAFTCGANGSNSLAYEGIHNAPTPQPPLTITHPAGLAFRLLSFDAGEIELPSQFTINAVGIGFVGTLAAGGTITAYVDLDGVIDGPAGVADFQSFVPSFADSLLTSLDVWGLYESGQLPAPPDRNIPVDARAGFQLDNIVFDVAGSHVDYTEIGVPEPTGLVLAIFAASFLSCVRRG